MYGSVLMVLMIMARLQVNIGPPVEQNKTDQILASGPYYGKNSLWLPTTGCTDSFMGLEVHCITAPSQLQHVITAQQLQQQHDWQTTCAPLAPVWGLWCLCDLWHVLHTWTCI